MSLPRHNVPLRVAIIAENFLPKIDGSTITLAHLLRYLQSCGGVRAMLFGPESGMADYAGARLFGTFGVPLKVYPGLKINFISPTFLAALRAFAPDVIHLVDPIWLGVQTLSAIRVLFPATPIVTSHHTNLPTYAAIFGYPYWHHRTWALHQWFHSFAAHVLVPSASTAALLSAKGWERLRVCSRGVDRAAFSPEYRSAALRASWGAHRPSDVVVISIGRLSPEKNLALLVAAFAALPPAARTHAKLVFVGDGPFRAALQALCTAARVTAVFTGQLTGRLLGEAFASADIMCAPSITETFGQVTLQAMASGLPVVGFYVEGTADLVLHPSAHAPDAATGLLVDVHAPGVAAAAERARTQGEWWAWRAPSTPSESDAPAPASPSDPEAEPYDPLAPLVAPRLASHRSCHAMMEPSHPAHPEIVRRFAACLAALVCEEPRTPLTSSTPTPLTSSTSLTPPTPPTSPTSATPLLPPTPPTPLTPLTRAAARRASMGARARARAEAYRWERCAGRILETYVDAVRGGAPRGGREYDYRGEFMGSGAAELAADVVVEEGEGDVEGDVEAGVVVEEGEGDVDVDAKLPDGPSASSPLLDSSAKLLRAGPALEEASGTGIWRTVAETVQPLVDAAVVMHALTAATLSHAAYMVPAHADLWGA